MNKLMWPDVPAKVDKFTSIRWMAPSTLRLITGVCLPGRDARDNGRGYHAIHILTPETDQHHALFLHRGPLRRVHQG